MEPQMQNNGRVVDINKPTANMIMQSDTLFKNNSQVSLKGIVEQSKTSEIFFSEANIDIIQQTYLHVHHLILDIHQDTLMSTFDLFLLFP